MNDFVRKVLDEVSEHNISNSVHFNIKNPLQPVLQLGLSGGGLHYLYTIVRLFPNDSNGETSCRGFLMFLIFNITSLLNC